MGKIRMGNAYGKITSVNKYQWGKIQWGKYQCQNILTPTNINAKKIRLPEYTTAKKYQCQQVPMPENINAEKYQYHKIPPPNNIFVRKLDCQLPKHTNAKNTNIKRYNNNIFLLQCPLKLAEKIVGKF